MNHTPHDPTPTFKHLSLATATPSSIHHRKLTRLRQSPIARLLAGSPWVLKAYQLDMDSPPSFSAFIDDELTKMLRKHSDGATIDTQTIHQLSIQFSSDSEPAVDANGEEHFSCRLTLSQLARTTQDPGSYLGLIRHMEADRPLSPQLPTLTLSRWVKLIMRATWSGDYRKRLEAFWRLHEGTYHLMACLSFLDGLNELKRKRRISLEGYVLALDALGLERFPCTLAQLAAARPGQRSAVSLFALDGQTVPGVFQLKSNATSHCFIHVLGDQPASVEYISSDGARQTQKLLHALNASPWHRLHLDLDPLAEGSAQLSMVEVHQDLFSLLTQAQRDFLYEKLESLHAEYQPETDDDSLSMPVERALKVISSLDLWTAPAPLQRRVPDPLKVANRLMGKHLQQQYGLKLDPRSVFVRYQHGNHITALGHARAPVTNVQVPDETPISLAHALISQYRVAYPVGYVDEGGESVVYLDPQKKGEFSESQRLPVPAQALEQHIRSVDFLQIMTRRLRRFWDRQGTAIEQSLQATFIAQALLGLKRGTLSRPAFDILEQMLDEIPLPAAQRQTHCSALSFYLQRSVLQGAHCACCTGLMVFSHAHKPHRILYQPGQQEAFVEFRNREQLAAHLVSAAAELTWRTTLLDYIPQHLHSRLTYILQLWGKIREPMSPVSNLRPWTDVLYNEDAHLAQAGDLCEHSQAQSPFAFMVDTLRRNSLSDAEGSISTAKEVLLRYWTQQLNRLQRLLAPLSLLLPPAFAASLLANAASLALNIQSAALPGDREKEQRQMMLTLLSFGLLQLAPLTPGLLRALSSFMAPIKPAVGAAVVITRGFSGQLLRTMNPRQTLLERFFGNGSLLKNWTIPGYPRFATFPVKAWKLERRFLLWTSDRAQARTLVVSTHGYYFPWSKTAVIPNGTELRTYVPHGFELTDPRLHRIVSQNVQPFSLLNNTQNLPGPAFSRLPAWQLTDKVLAGTSHVGKIKNYTLAKFQSERYESYRDIGNIVRHSHQSPFFGQLTPTPMDVLTIRNRFGMSNPSLQDLFGALSRQGIHYDRILLVHCRCSAIDSIRGRAPGFVAPNGFVPVSP